MNVAPLILPIIGASIVTASAVRTVLGFVKKGYKPGPHNNWQRLDKNAQPAPKSNLVKKDAAANDNAGIASQKKVAGDNNA